MKIDRHLDTAALSKIELSQNLHLDCFLDWIKQAIIKWLVEKGWFLQFVSLIPPLAAVEIYCLIFSLLESVSQSWNLAASQTHFVI